MVILWVVRVFWKLTHRPKKEEYCSYMQINHTFTCVLHRHGHALCALRDIMMINEIMKPTLCIELTCDSPLLAPFRLPSTLDKHSKYYLITDFSDKIYFCFHQKVVAI